MSSQSTDTLDREALISRLQNANRELELLRKELDGLQARELKVRTDLVRSTQLETLSDLVKGVAHEINTPLGALASNHDLTKRALGRLQIILEDERVTEDELGEVRRIVHAIDSVQETSAMAVDRMKHVLSSLRTVGRPDRSQVDRVDFAEALQGTLDLLNHELGGTIAVEVELQPLPLVECFAQQVNQVFMNLMMNAIHAMPSGGTLTIRARPSDERVLIEIEDTGTGIPEENLERIFESGFTTKGERVGIGMGLGLMICSEIVDRHGGEISVESQPGVGTRFTVSLPLSLPEDRRPPAEQAT